MGAKWGKEEGLSRARKVREEKEGRLEGKAGDPSIPPYITLYNSTHI